MSVYGIAILICVLIIRLFPEIITVIIFYDTEYKGWSRKIKFLIMAPLVILSSIFNFGTYLLIHYKIFYSWNVVKTILDIGRLNVFYQNYTYFTKSFLVCIVAAIVMGIVLKYLLKCFVDGTYGQNGFSVQSKAVLLLMISVTGLAAIGSYGVKTSGNSKLFINEVCSNNRSVFLDENQKISDYIEVYNAGWLPYLIDGVYLSDDKNELEKYELPLNILKSQGYQLIELDENTPFQISDSGESLYLSLGGGNTRSS